MLSASNASVRCEACKSYRKSLRSMHSRSIKSNDKENSDLSTHANHRFMKSSVKNKLLSQLHRKVRISNKRIKCLQEKLEAATRIHGVELDEELHRDMQDIMRSHAHSVSQLKADSFPTNLNYPYAQFPCADPTGDTLIAPLWEAVMRLEA